MMNDEVLDIVARRLNVQRTALNDEMEDDGATWGGVVVSMLLGNVARALHEAASEIKQIEALEERHEQT